MKHLGDIYYESYDSDSEHKNHLVSKLNKIDEAAKMATIKAMNDEIERILPDLKDKPIKHYLWELIKMQYVNLVASIKRILRSILENKENH